ncbi:MAG: WXG100 family type VII secretion target [Anaerolineae bacterium]|nr:WXG100 family type VII secretion target [Anaerolineae bacterium]MDW8172992.1 WXG100 family type VII secretion target [Anaerolineae bacterium]
MNADIQVNYEQLEEIARRFASCADVTETVLNGLRRTMDDLRGGWEGEASKRFFDEMEGRVLPRLRRLNHALSEGQQTTQQIARTFQEAEEQAAQLFQGTGTQDGLASGNKGMGNLLGAMLPAALLGAIMYNPSAIGMIAGGFVGGSLIANAIASALGSGTSGLRYGDTYNWGKMALDSFKMLDQVAELSDKAIYKTAENIAMSMTSDLKGFYTTLEKMNPAVTAAKIGLGGLIDWGLGEDHSIKELGVQVISQGIQSLPHVRVVSLASNVFQLAGNVSSELIEQNAAFFTGGDLQKAQSLIDSANTFQRELGKVDFDKRVDGLVRSITDGNLQGVAHEVETFVNGVGGVVTSGTDMIYKATEMPLQNARAFVEDVSQAVRKAIPKEASFNFRIAW